MDKPSEEALVKRNKTLTLIHDITQAFVGTLNSDALFQHMFKDILSATHAEAGSLWIVDTKTGNNVCKFAEGPAKEGLFNMHMAKGKGIVGHVIDHKEPIIALDTSQNEFFSNEMDAFSKFETKSMICYPIIVDDAAIGGIQLINKAQGEAFDDDDVMICEALTKVAGIAIKNAQLYEQSKKAQEIQSMLQLSNDIISSLDIDKVMLSVVNLTQSYIPYKRAIIALIDGEDCAVGAITGLDIVPQDTADMHDLKQLLLDFSTSKAPLHIAIKGGKSLSKLLQGYYRHHPDLKSLWVAPLRDSEGTLGVLMLESDKADFIQGYQLDILSLLSNQVSAALRNALLYKNIPTIGLIRDIEGRRPFYIKHALLHTTKRKVVSSLILLGLIVGSLIPLPFTATGTCVTDASQRIAITAPLTGKIIHLTDHVRLGNTLKRGDYLIKIQSDTHDKKIFAQQAGTILTPYLEKRLHTLVAKGDTLFETSDGSGIVLHTAIPAEYITHIRVDQPITFTLSGYPNQLFNATVTAISPLPKDRNGTLVYEVVGDIDPDAAPPQALVGLKGEAAISVGSRSMMSGMLQHISHKLKQLILF